MTYRELLTALERAHSLLDQRAEAEHRGRASSVPEGMDHSPGWWARRVREIDAQLDEDIP